MRLKKHTHMLAWGQKLLYELVRITASGFCL